MKRIKQALLLGAAATATITAVAFTQAKAKIEAAAPAVSHLAPAYSLPDQNGTVRTSAENKGRVTLLAFYPADFTGGCTVEAHSLSSSYKDLKAMGVQVYGVSVQDPKSHNAFCTKEGIPYTLLADTQHKMAADYGVLIPGANIANRVTYIIGADGKVAYVDGNVNSHLNTCGDDWIAWIKAHPAVKTSSIDNNGTTSVFFSGEQQPVAHPQMVTVSLRLRKTGPAVVGQATPNFSLPDAITGNPTGIMNLMTPTTKAIVVMFVSTRCPYSNAYVGRMKSLASKYAPLGVSFVGIDSDQNEPKAEVASYSKSQGFPFPVLEDRGDKVANAYAARVTPETYVIRGDGTLVYHGRIDNDMDPANVHTHDLANALDAVLAGKPVAKAETKAFGCSIKR